MSILAVATAAIATAGLPAKAVEFLGPTVHVLGRGAQDFMKATHPESEGGGKVTKAEWTQIRDDMLDDLKWELERIADKYIAPDAPAPAEPPAPSFDASVPPADDSQVRAPVPAPGAPATAVLDPGPTKEDFAALVARVAELEAELAARAAPPATPPMKADPIVAPDATAPPES